MKKEEKKIGLEPFKQLKKMTKEECYKGYLRRAKTLYEKKLKEKQNENINI